MTFIGAMQYFGGQGLEFAFSRMSLACFLQSLSPLLISAPIYFSKMSEIMQNYSSKKISQ